MDEEYAPCLCSERSNAFVLAMFWYAMASESVISFEAPMSKKLYNGLTKKLMPALAESGFAPVNLSGPVTSEPVSCQEGYAAGMSCGVDSFYTLHSYESELTHLTFYDGSYILPYAEAPYNIDEIFEERKRTFSEFISRARIIADDEEFQAFAEVCFNQEAGHKNCGDCFGCWKTMIPLDFLGKLDLYDRCFDVNKYYSNRRKVFEDLIRFSFLPKSVSARDTVKQLLALAKKLPPQPGESFQKSGIP